MSDRPKLELQKEPIDLLIEGITIIVVLLSIIIPAYYYNQLPEKIPIHFDGLGNPDDYGSKQMIWLLPAIGAFMFITLYQVSKYPYTYNYLKTITEDNAAYQYKLASQLMRVLNLITCSIFCYISWKSIQVALERATGLGSLFLGVSIAVMGVVLGFYIYNSSQSN